MAVRSKRLFGPTTIGVVSVTLYTAPAGETALVKLLTAVNVALVGSTSLQLRLNGTSGANLIAIANVPNGADQWLEGFVVMQPGDVLRGIASQASIICTGFGAELEGVAD